MDSLFEIEPVKDDEHEREYWIDGIWDHGHIGNPYFHVMDK